jgi:hypothetical protein
MEDIELENEIVKIEKGDAWDETDEVVQLEVKKPLDMVIPVRLSSEKWRQIRAEAKELGIGPSTLVRMWILERLRQQVKTRG